MARRSRPTIHCIFPLQGDVGRLSNVSETPEGMNNRLQEARVASTALQAREEKAFQALLTHIQQAYGLDYSRYKPTFVKRRVSARLRARGLSSYHDYLQLLRTDPREYEHLLASLTIGFTSFFRDASTFETLRDQVLRPLLHERARRGERRFRAWSAGCATGEETYSLAILLHQILGPRVRHWDVRILGTDIDPRALERARRGVYTPFSFRGTQWPRLDRFFSITAEGRAVIPQLKALVHFQRHNLMTDPPPGRFDLILCRNVLIYFRRSQQVDLCRQFHQALVPAGILVLGKTETLPPEVMTSFETVHLGERLYRKRDAGG